MPGMSQNIKIRKGRVANAAPVVTITAFVASPANGVSEGPFTATAIDAVDGDISANIIWSTVEDGDLATGASVSLTFPASGSPHVPAARVLTARVVDTGALTGTDTQSVTVT